jgi:hypothetical protein
LDAVGPDAGFRSARAPSAVGERNSDSKPGGVTGAADTPGPRVLEQPLLGLLVLVHLGNSRHPAPRPLPRGPDFWARRGAPAGEAAEDEAVTAAGSEAAEFALGSRGSGD